MQTEQHDSDSALFPRRLASNFDRVVIETNKELPTTRLRRSNEPFIRIIPMGHGEVSQVATLHRSVLSQTFSSRLGQGFLEEQYRVLLGDPKSRGWVAVKESSLVGFITATLDLHASEAFLKRRMPFKQKARALLRVLTHWYDLCAFVSHCRMTRYCRRFGKPYPILLTLGVAPGTLPTIAYKLMDAAHVFYKESGYARYFLDTLADNYRAQEFYRLLGFEEQGRIAGNLILGKKT